MKVKAIHFIDAAPFQPIYELEDGRMRIPFKNSEDGTFAWFTEKEALNMFAKNEAQNSAIQELFKHAKISIEQSMLKKIIN